MRYARRVLGLIWLIPLVFIVVTPASDKGTNGKDLYKQNCRVCHEKGSPNGEFSPMTRIQDQWKSFFSTKLALTHKEIVLPGQSKKLLEALTPEQIKIIQKFCVDHAADSEQPQTCS
jgi:hypothetical protein